MTSLLPYEFHCLRHISSIYARNVPPQWEASRDGLDAASAGTALEVSAGQMEDSSPSSAPPSSSFSFPSRSIKPPRHSLSTRMFYRLRLPEPDTILYTSEECRGTQHPSWRCIPDSVVRSHGDTNYFLFELYCVKGTWKDDERGDTKRHNVDQQSSVLVCQWPVDMRQMLYVGQSVTEADCLTPARAAPQLKSSTINGSCGCLAIFVKCADGIFYVPPSSSSCDVNAPQAGARNIKQPTPFPFHAAEVVWSRSPADVGQYQPPPPSQLSSSYPTLLLSPSTASLSKAEVAANRKAAALGVSTVGDLLLLAGATLTWRYWAAVAEARRDEYLTAIDTTIMLHNPAVRRAATVAVLKSELTSRRERLTLQTLELEKARAVLQERRTALERQEEAIALLAKWRRQRAKRYAEASSEAGAATSPKVDEQDGLTISQGTDHIIREEELLRAELRARLANTRRQRTRELNPLFPIELSEHEYGVLSSHHPARTAKDTIMGATLPVIFQSRSEREAGVAAGGGGGAMPVMTSTSSTFISGGTAAMGGLPGQGAGSTLRGSSSSSSTGVNVGIAPIGTRHGVMNVNNAAGASAAMTGLVAASYADILEEATALGHVCHLLNTLSILYGCTLPYPVLMAGSRSRVLARPDLTPDQVLASCARDSVGGGGSLPLYCQRASERGAMAAGVRLLVKDALALAHAMGVDPNKLALCGLRLGATLHILMTD